MRIVVATRSAGKLAELRPLFASAGHEVVDLASAGIAERAAEEKLEEFATFEENALAKARYFARLAAGHAVVADDSGLGVRALGGEPGVMSKRWSGRPDLSGRALDAANNAKLMARLAGVTDRSARFVCAAALVAGDREVVWRGETEGMIVDAARGAGGFGYDPYFESVELGRTFAELSVAEKERVSHRGRAFRGLLAELGGGH